MRETNLTSVWIYIFNSHSWCVQLALMNGQGHGNQGKENNLFDQSAGCIICTSADGWVGWATPLIWASSVSPTNVNYGGIGEGWRGANMLLAVGVSLNPRIPPRGGPEVMSRRGSYHSPIHLDDGVIRFEISNHWKLDRSFAFAIKPVWWWGSFGLQYRVLCLFVLIVFLLFLRNQQGAFLSVGIRFSNVQTVQCFEPGQPVFWPNYQCLRNISSVRRQSHVQLNKPTSRERGIFSD